MSETLALTGRCVRLSLRSVDALMIAVALPVLLMLMFVYVFGGALDASGRYVDYVVPGVVLLCAGFGAASTAVAVNQDLTNGIVDRLRSLPIAGSAVLAGHVAASVLRNLLSTALVLVVALLIGFEPQADAAEWLGAIGVLVAFMIAVSWLAACFGMIASNAEAASAFSFLLMFLPYVSSAFVPLETMPGVLRAIGEHQPVTPIVETLRGLLLGAPLGGEPAVALAWCAGLAAAGCAGALLLFRRRA